MQKFNLDALTFSADPSVPTRRGGFLTPPKGACGRWTFDITRKRWSGRIYKSARDIRERKKLEFFIETVGV